MTDIVEELAKFICEEEYDELSPMDKAIWQASAKDILTFLQPHLLEKDKLAKKLWVKRMSRDPETGEITWCELHDQMGEPAHGEAVYVLNERELTEREKEAYYAGSANTEVILGVGEQEPRRGYAVRKFEHWQAEQKGKV